MLCGDGRRRSGTWQVQPRRHARNQTIPKVASKTCSRRPLQLSLLGVFEAPDPGAYSRLITYDERRQQGVSAVAIYAETVGAALRRLTKRGQMPGDGRRISVVKVCANLAMGNN
jgi:hypothetical protein